MTEAEKLRDTLLQSLYDYYLAYNGASYTLPKAMINTDKNSKLAIEYLIDNGYATNSGEESENLVSSITTKGMEYIKNK